MPDSRQERKINTNPEESKIDIAQEETLDLAGVITYGLREVMCSRNAMTGVERNVTEWIKEQKDHSPETKKKIMEQMVNAKLALESLYNRVQMEY